MRDHALPGRPRTFDETKTVRQFMKLFWQKGYEGVSLSDIMAATGLRKGSLYAAFGNKRSMYLRALVQYNVDEVDAAAKALEDTHSQPLQRIEAFLSLPVEAARLADRSGCFLCNASADQADLDDETKLQVTRGFERLDRALIVPVSEIGCASNEAAVAAKARAFLAVYSGLRVMARSGLAPEILEAVRDEVLSLAISNV